MAETDELSRAEEEQESSRLNGLKRDLEHYREILLPLNKVLEWEKPQYPAILIGIITLVFAIIWYLEPSVLTTFSLIGIVVSMVDFVIPLVSSYLFGSKEWTVVEERKFENICIRLLNAKTHLHNLKVMLSKMKMEKPKIYAVVLMASFAVLAWFGSLIDNLLLTYIMVVFSVLVPGLRKHGILQKFTAMGMEVVMRVIKKPQKKAGKSKSN
ncbi:ADP-ribosylation factor-like protein 6-interacting protein 1 [Lamellibrachia satsuma]|nr:ADP-ribosylation factor-like protein 6-interacting protein 1 [Lamellibrachia satsuma]